MSSLRCQSSVPDVEVWGWSPSEGLRNEVRPLRNQGTKPLVGSSGAKPLRLLETVIISQRSGGVIFEIQLV